MQQDELEVIALLAARTTDAEQIFIRLAKCYKLVQFASLLIVDHKRFLKLADTLSRHFDSLIYTDKDHYEKVNAMNQLIHVFQTAGDAISSYVKQDKFNVRAYITMLILPNITYVSVLMFPLPLTI